MVDLRGFRRFLALSRSERKYFFEAIIILYFIRIALIAVSFRTISRRLQLGRRAGEAPGPPDGVLRSVSLAIGRSARVAPGSNCLDRALAGAVMLNRRGCPATLCIGVAKPEGEFRAHAWVECDGDAVVGSGAGFSRVLVLPGAPS